MLPCSFFFFLLTTLSHPSSLQVTLSDCLWWKPSGPSLVRFLALLSPSALSYNIYRHLTPVYALCLPLPIAQLHLPPSTSQLPPFLPNSNISPHESTINNQKPKEKPRQRKTKQNKKNKHNQLSKLRLLTRAYQTEYASSSSDINGPLVGWLGTGLGYQMCYVRSGNESFCI